MGETGCGKTKLIDFMSKLQVPTALKGQVKPMEIVKVSEHVGKKLAHFAEACKGTEASGLAKFVRLCNIHLSTLKGKDFLEAINSGSVCTFNLIPQEGIEDYEFVQK